VRISSFSPAIQEYGMRKALFLLLFLAAASILGAGQNNFRSTRWGMSIKEVSRKETARFIKRINTGNDQQLLYRTSVGDMKARVIYDFNRNKLVMARYVFIIYDIDQGVEQYKTLREVLIKKYGQPEFSRRIVHGEKGGELASLTYLLFPLKIWIKEGLRNGKISLKTSWSKSETLIDLFLENKKDPDLYVLTVRYKSLLWANEQETLKAQKDKSKEEALFKAL